MCDQPPKEKHTLKFCLPAQEKQDVDLLFEDTQFDNSPSEERDVEKIDEKILLDPDHPLLAQFQRTLKQHLENQIAHLNDAVFELENAAKKKSIEREQLGLDTYEAQQVVNKQQRELEMCVQELETVCAATEQMELELEKAKNEYSKKRLEVLEIEKKEVHLRTEFETLNLLMQQMKSWEEGLESELTINQRVLEKTEKDRRQLAIEKRQLDAFIYKLMTETWRFEEDLDMLQMQIRVKEEEREQLAEAVVASNIDLETIAREHRCVLHSWNSLVVAISYRDKSYTLYKEELKKLQDDFRLTMIELVKTKKLCEKEMSTSENLEDLKRRAQNDVDNCTRTMESENKKKEALELELNITQNIIDQTELDIKKKDAENGQKNAELNLLTKEFEKLSCEKVQLDDQIIRALEVQMSNSKASKYLYKLACEVKEKNKALAITLSKVDNTNSKSLMEIEVLKCELSETEKFLNDVLKQMHVLEDQTKALQQEKERLQFCTVRKQSEVDIVSHKLQVALKKQEGEDMSPEELKILTLEKNIQDTQESIKKLQKFWLRQQGYVVNLSHQRQEQINDLNMLKTQLQLLIQKNLKINDELEGYQKQEEHLNRLVNNLQNRVVVVNEQISKKKGNKFNMEKETDLLQLEYAGKLQDAEMESIKLESDLADIEDDKATLTDRLLDMNREALAWEKKIQMAVEAKKSIDKEKGEGGEMENMRLEIHRMHVRYGQLKKAQEKLVHDLDHCVVRRDAILSSTEAREKKEKGGTDKTRINFLRKLEDMKCRLKQIEAEIEKLSKKMDAAGSEEQRLLTEIASVEQDTAFAKRKTETLKEEIEEKKTDRQNNLELLVLKQKKLKVYSELQKGRKPFLAYRTDETINSELDKEKDLNNRISNVVENLLVDFPHHKQVITRIRNTAKLPFLHLYT